MALRKVTRPEEIVTDTEVLRELERQGIDSSYVKFERDYCPATPAAKFYRDLQTNKQFAVISGLPKVTKEGKRIVARWRQVDGRFVSMDNVFRAGVTDETVAVTVGRQSAEWSPQVFIKLPDLDWREVFPSSEKPALIFTDLKNSNYHYNILEWDYGICKRWLRIIEGRLIERFVFESDPGGDIRIKSNWKGSIKAARNWAKDSAGNALPVETVGDEEIIKAEHFTEPQFYKIYTDIELTDKGLGRTGHCVGCGLCGTWDYVMATNSGKSLDETKKIVDKLVERTLDAEIRWALGGQIPVECGYALMKDGKEVVYVSSSKKYPITIASSPETFYPDGGVDGEAQHDESGTGQPWSTVRDGAGNNSDSAATTLSVVIWSGTESGDYTQIKRGLLSFLTSSLPENAVITDVTLTLYGESKGNGWSGLSPAYNVYGASLATPTAIVDGDYDGVSRVPFSTEIAFADFDVNGSTPLANAYVFNQNGKDAVNKTGYTMLSFQESIYDVPDNEPTWEDFKLAEVSVATNEWGSPYVPKLVVTYTWPFSLLAEIEVQGNLSATPGVVTSLSGTAAVDSKLSATSRNEHSE